MGKRGKRDKGDPAGDSDHMEIRVEEDESWHVEEERVRGTRVYSFICTTHGVSL